MAIYYLDGKRLKRILYASTQWLVANEQVLNEINVFPVPDGDTGTNMGATLRSVINSLPNNKENDLPQIAEAMAHGALFGARGNSGVILSQILKGFSDSIDNRKRLNALDITHGLKKAYAHAYDAVSDPKEGTILTVVRDSVNAAHEKAKTEPAIDMVIETLLEEAKKSLANTPNLLPLLKDAGVVDAGALGFVYFVEGIYMLLKGHSLPEIDIPAAALIKNEALDNHHSGLAHFYGYCTEFFLHSKNVDLKAVKIQLQSWGDSLVVASGDSAHKIHIHSRHPGKILEECLRYGLLTNIKIENMDEQHARLESKVGQKETVFVAVALGEGVKKIFESLGCEIVILCGRTMNPSVAELAAACEKYAAKNYIILPNDNNVIFIAEQLAALHKNKNIIIMPTKTIPEGFSALLAFNPEATLEENLHAMRLSVKRVKSGEITKAAKNSSLHGLKIRKDDIIAIHHNRIINRFANAEQAVISLVATMKNQDHELISLFYSEDISEDEARRVEKKLRQEYKDLEIEVHHGGQPYFSYIVSME
jgi:DAK2 domain fusion protein YloV